MQLAGGCGSCQDVKVPTKGTRLPYMCKKTKWCSFFLENACTRGEACNFAHCASELRIAPDLHCTKLCPSVSRGIPCKLPNCGFAHSREELRRFAPETAAAQRRKPKGDGKSGAESDTGFSEPLELEQLRATVNGVPRSLSGNAAAASSPASAGRADKPSAFQDRPRHGFPMVNFQEEEQVFEALYKSEGRIVAGATNHRLWISEGRSAGYPSEMFESQGDDDVESTHSGDGHNSSSQDHLDDFTRAHKVIVLDQSGRQIICADRNDLAFSGSGSLRQKPLADFGGRAAMSQGRGAVGAEPQAQSNLPRSSIPPEGVTQNAPSPSSEPTGKAAGTGRNRHAKTKLCAFWLEGFCKKGAQCNFLHDEAEAQQQQRSTLPVAKDSSRQGLVGGSEARMHNMSMDDNPCMQMGGCRGLPPQDSRCMPPAGQSPLPAASWRSMPHQPPTQSMGFDSGLHKSSAGASSSTSGPAQDFPMPDDPYLSLGQSVQGQRMPASGGFGTHRLAEDVLQSHRWTQHGRPLDEAFDCGPPADSPSNWQRPAYGRGPPGEGFACGPRVEELPRREQMDYPAAHYRQRRPQADGYAHERQQYEDGSTRPRAAHGSAGGSFPSQQPNEGWDDLAGAHAGGLGQRGQGFVGRGDARHMGQPFPAEQHPSGQGRCADDIPPSWQGATSSAAPHYSIWESPQLEPDRGPTAPRAHVRQLPQDVRGRGWQARLNEDHDVPSRMQDAGPSNLQAMPGFQSQMKNAWCDDCHPQQQSRTQVYFDPSSSVADETLQQGGTHERSCYAGRVDEIDTDPVADASREADQPDQADNRASFQSEALSAIWQSEASITIKNTFLDVEDPPDESEETKGNKRSSSLPPRARG